MNLPLVDTPNGEGVAFGVTEEGHIFVNHSWNVLPKSITDDPKRIKSSSVIIIYPPDQVKEKS